MNTERLLAAVGTFGQVVDTTMTTRSAAEANALIEAMTVEFRQTLAALELPGNTAEGENPFDYITAALQEITHQLDSLHATDTDQATALTGLADTLRGELDTRVAELIDGSPAALDTLRELSAALGDDADFAARITTSLADKVDKTAGQSLITDDERNKLTGIATGATKNATDASLRARSSHTGTQSVSSITGLGTAATTDKQSTLSDASVGNLMLNGAHGFGGPSLHVPAGMTSWNDLPITNSRWKAQNMADAPRGSMAWFTVDQLVLDANFLMQTAVCNTGALANRMYRRLKSGGAWNPWREFYLESNIVGPIVNSTEGAIIERGANANGEYVRYADGTQICWGRLWVNGITLQPGARTDSYGWTFPARFVTDTLNCHVSNQSGWVYDYNVGFEGMSVAYLSSIFIMNIGGTPHTTDHILHLTAIGRWFN